MIIVTTPIRTEVETIVNLIPRKLFGGRIERPSDCREQRGVMRCNAHAPSQVGANILSNMQKNT